MATTLNIQRFIRNVRQGRTAAPVSCTAMPACTQQAYDALLAANWSRVDEKRSGLPRHHWAQTGFSNRWDASKYCGDYADGFQHGYATAVCYTIRLPADALAGTTANIKTLQIPVYGDRWLADGCDIEVRLSASATPPAWGVTPDDAVTGQLAVVPSNTGTDTSAIVTFDWSAAPKTTLAYLHITLRLTNYLTHRGAWIEGSAMIDGAAVAVEFDRDVTPDTETKFDDPLVAYARHQPPPIGTHPWAFYAATAHPLSATFALSATAWRQTLNNHHVLQEATTTPTVPGAYLITTDEEMMAVSHYQTWSLFSVGVRFGALHPQNISSLPVSAYTSIRVVLYGVSSGAFNLAAEEWINKLDATTVVPGSFWRGEASSVTAEYNDASTAALQVTCLADVIIPPGGLIGHDYIPFSQPWTPAGDAAVIVCYSVHDIILADDVIDTIALATPDTPHGWLSAGNYHALLRQATD